jgi:hypothetical protein
MIVRDNLSSLGAEIRLGWGATIGRITQRATQWNTGNSAASLAYYRE